MNERKKKKEGGGGKRKRLRRSKDMKDLSTSMLVQCITLVFASSDYCTKS